MRLCKVLEKLTNVIVLSLTTVKEEKYNLRNVSWTIFILRERITNICFSFFIYVF